nr:MAG TPA: hypothetical protein [Caudoviricetes sp.]
MIVISYDKVVFQEVYDGQTILVFKTPAIRQQFFNEQQKLLKIAKPLL